MKNKLIILITLFSFMIAAEIKGYSIFNYDNNAFSVDRAYFQYTDDISDELFFKLRYDVGRDSDVEGDTKLSSYLKNAYVDWKIDDLGKLSMGLLSTNSYSVQEKTWGDRYIYKSAMELYDFSASDVINKLNVKELEKIFKFFGEEKDAKKNCKYYRKRKKI